MKALGGKLSGLFPPAHDNVMDYALEAAGVNQWCTVLLT